MIGELWFIFVVFMLVIVGCIVTIVVVLVWLWGKVE